MGLIVALLSVSASSGEEQTSGDSEHRLPEIQQWIEALGSNEFAARERAADSLISLGFDAVEPLEKAHQETLDPEVKLRTQKLIHQLRSGSQEARIELFLAGKDVDFENWGVIKEIFGDIPKSRDLFVELLQTYPKLVSSLDGTSRELVVAMDTVTETINTNRSRLGWQPRVSDVLAMLLPATDENVPVSVGYEKGMLYLTRLAPVNRLPKDKVLGPPFSRLLGTWMLRSQLANRQAVLYFAMEWDLEQAYELALNSLGQTTDVEVLAHAMQAIAKHGKETDAAFLLPYLDDTRPAVERRFVRDRVVEPQLCDVAMAAIAVLTKTPMKEIGQNESVKHEKFAFIYEEVGFPPGDQEQRLKARKKIKQVVSNRSNGSEQHGS